VSAAEHEAALTNFQAGRRFVEQNNCREAIPRFIESLKHEQNVGARFNLAECSRKEGREVDAWNQYKNAEQLAIAKNDDRRNDARKAINELEPKVLKLRLVLPPLVNMNVRIDGHPVERADFGLLETGYALEPNQPHTVEVTAQNHDLWVKTDVKGPPGAELPAMTVDLGQDTTGTGQRFAGIVVGGAGIVGLAVGSVLGVIAIGKNSNYNNAIKNECADKTNCPADVSTARQAISGPATAATIAFIAGGALVAAGAVIYLTAPKAPTTSAARLRLVPALGPGAAGATLGATF